MNEKKAFRPVPGLTREAEEKQLALIIDTAQENLEKTRKNIQTQRTRRGCLFSIIPSPS